jgi:DNA-directed RNA polymerase specialized sigma subunit
MNNERREVEEKNFRKSIREISVMSQIYRLMLSSSLSIEEIASRLNAMKKEHDKTPDAEVSKLLSIILATDTLDEKSKRELDNRYNKISQEIYRKEGIKDLMKAINDDDIEYKGEHTE